VIPASRPDPIQPFTRLAPRTFRRLGGPGANAGVAGTQRTESRPAVVIEVLFAQEICRELTAARLARLWPVMGGVMIPGAAEAMAMAAPQNRPTADRTACRSDAVSVP
jgi:hypothetical protein